MLEGKTVTHGTSEQAIKCPRMKRQVQAVDPSLPVSTVFRSLAMPIIEVDALA